jgi:hypothetical protein
MNEQINAILEFVTQQEDECFRQAAKCMQENDFVFHSLNSEKAACFQKVRQFIEALPKTENSGVLGNTKIYRIQHRESKLYAKKGTSDLDIWSVAGAIWSKIGAVKNYVAQFIPDGYHSASDRFYEYLNADIVEIGYASEKRISIAEYMLPIMELNMNRFISYHDPNYQSRIDTLRPLIEMCREHVHNV